MSLIKKIDEMKVTAKRIIVNKPVDRLDEIANDISEGYITACDEIMDNVLSEQKEPELITIGDKIRESNESLARYIETVVAIALEDKSFFDIERRINYLNQPYTDIEEVFDRR